MAPETEKQVTAVAQRLLKLAATSHWWHLGTKSYAQHKALGDLYGYLHEAADGLVEPAVGDGMKIVEPKLDDMLAEIRFLCGEIKKLKGEPWLENIAQEIDGQLYGYVYKLQRLS